LNAVAAGSRSIVEEVIFDDLGLVAKAQVEILAAEVIVDPHDVPQDRPPADRNHRLRLELGFLAKPRTLASTENNDPKIATLHGLLQSILLCRVHLDVSGRHL
jgi:hypothetical protein